jgi:hypothetical protein
MEDVIELAMHLMEGMEAAKNLPVKKENAI